MGILYCIEMLMRELGEKKLSKREIKLLLLLSDLIDVEIKEQRGNIMIHKEIKREEFIKDYQNLPLKIFCEQLGISTTTLYKILDEEGIPRNHERKEPTKVKLI